MSLFMTGLILSTFLLVFLLLLLCLIHLYNTVRFKIYSTRTLHAPVKKPPLLKSFVITNPYDCPGKFHKAQLHMHTSNSVDVRTKIPVPRTIKRYQQAGYSFCVITDHNKVTEAPPPDESSGFLVIPGMEMTIPFITRPLGRHLIRMGVKTDPSRNPGSEREPPTEMIMPAHPNWEGNLGTGRWLLQDLIKLPNLRLLEIFNRHSDTAADILLWHKLLQNRGYQNPVWGAAVDDSDNGQPVDRGWIMIKTVNVTRESFLNALKNGNFYATTGPEANFGVDNKIIFGETLEKKATITFINSQNQKIACSCGKSAEYQPNGDEGFIRVEITDPDGKTAWSQPFFLLPPPR